MFGSMPSMSSFSSNGHVHDEKRPQWDLSGKHAIFVLGPSAAGKTFLTKENLRRVLTENAFDPRLSFVSIDGGIMREMSTNWEEMKRLPMQRRVKYEGFSDLFSTYFKSSLGTFKKKVFHALLKKGANMTIPETAADPFPGIRGRTVEWMKLLRQENYHIVMTCVCASRKKCLENGQAREVKEGKKYNNVSWSWAMSKVHQLFNYGRELGYRKETFFVFDNSDWTVPQVYVRVRPHYETYLNYFYEDGDTKAHFTTQPMAIPSSLFLRMESLLSASAAFTVSSRPRTQPAILFAS